MDLRLLAWFNNDRSPYKWKQKKKKPHKNTKKKEEKKPQNPVFPPKVDCSGDEAGKAEGR